MSRHVLRQTPSTVKLSIALVTRNRPSLLDEAVASIRRQSVQPDEIVISDDSTGPYETDVKAVADRWDCCYLRGPGRGLYANRNFAAVHASGTHIRTMDDDHTLPEGHLAQCLAAVQSDPASIWTTGEVGFVDGRLKDVTATATQLWPWGGGGPLRDRDDNWAIADGATIYPRAVFDTGLRMVEDYGFGSSYLEFGAYLYRRGYRSRCIPSALVHHHARSEDLARDGLDLVASRLFASVCYNLHFRPHVARAARHIASHLLRQGRARQLGPLLPGILKKAHGRWNEQPVTSGSICW